MKYLKKFNEMLDPMGSWNPSQLDNKEYEYDGVPSIYDEDDEIIVDDTDDFCPKCDCIPCQCTGEELDDEDEDLKEGLDEYHKEHIQLQPSQIQSHIHLMTILLHQPHVQSPLYKSYYLYK